MATWRGYHAVFLIAFVVAIVALGLVSTYVEFDADSDWGLWAFLILIGLLTFLIGAVGHGLVRRIDGALMDQRFRITLSQFQVSVARLQPTLRAQRWSCAFRAQSGRAMPVESREQLAPCA